MTLKEYIRSCGGPKKFAKKHGFTHRAAVAYAYGERVPERKAAAKLVAESDLTYDDIYGAASACG